MRYDSLARDLKRNRIAVLIAALNEAKAIGDLVRGVPPDCDVFIVDDGSEDDTATVARDAGATVISLPINLGQSAASYVGYRLIADLGYEYLVKMDGDGQHDPSEIPKLIEALETSTCDVIVGSRLLGSNYKGAPLARRLFLRPLNWVINLLTGYELTDTMCGYRAFRGSKLSTIVRIFGQAVEPEYLASEMWIRFSQAGIKVGEVPVNLARRRAGFSYKGLFRYAWGVISTIVRTKLETYKYKYQTQQPGKGREAR